MTTDTREMILNAARTTAQAHGYNGLSFRELAKAVGIKSASIHYHFPTKGDLGAALARQYSARAAEDMVAILQETRDPAACIARYVALFRRALEQDNRMCLCGIMAAEYDDLPEPVRAEVIAFADLNRMWLSGVLAQATAPDGLTADDWALAVHAAIGGAQLAARSRSDIAVYDAIVASYAASGLLPR